MPAPAIYQALAYEKLGADACGNLTSNKSLSELVRAIQGMAWIQVAGKGLEWAGDLVSFYITIKDGLKDQVMDLKVTFAQLGAGGEEGSQRKE